MHKCTYCSDVHRSIHRRRRQMVRPHRTRARQSQMGNRRGSIRAQHGQDRAGQSVEVCPLPADCTVSQRGHHEGLVAQQHTLRGQASPQAPQTTRPNRRRARIISVQGPLVTPCRSQERILLVLGLCQNGIGQDSRCWQSAQTAQQDNTGPLHVTPAAAR